MVRLETAFTQALDLAAPIAQGPMGNVSGPPLVAAVAAAGGLGILPIWMIEPAAAVGSPIQATQNLTSRPFAVNVRADLVQLDHIRAALDAGVSIIHLFWGDPGPCVAPIHNAGARMIATVWDGDSARRAVDAGACALIAQGVEAGGHVLGTTPLTALLEEVCRVAGDVPVAAAGGLADANDVVKVFQLGAEAAVLGTRFAATTESDAHDAYKQMLLAAVADSTVRSECFDGLWPQAPHRTLRNSTFDAWDAAGRPPAGRRPGENDVILHTPDGQSIPRYSVVPPDRGMTGDYEAAALYAGTGVSRITALADAAGIVADITDALRARATR